jgi:phosphoenolpyruvate carboxylase
MARSHAQDMAILFGGDLSDADALSKAANELTAGHVGKLLSLAPIIAALEDEAARSEPDRANALLTLVAAMRIDGLGMGGIHFRVNSSQLDNAIRRRKDGYR